MYLHINQKGIYFQGKARDLIKYLKNLESKHFYVKDALRTLH